MKIAIICDTHWGARGDSAIFLNYFSKFFNNVFFPYIEKNDIDTIIIAGDVVDRRKYINFLTASKMRENFLEKMKNKKVYIIAGNHDCYFKTHNELNALTELLSSYNFSIYTKPIEINVGNTPILLMPWIAPDNIDESIFTIKNTKSQIMIGHLQIAGFEMHAGSYCDDGMNMTEFSKFDLVCTGHFHHKSSKGNIHYLGAPYQMTWVDYNDPRGFHILDTNTRELIFIENPYEIFFKVIYDDKNKLLEEIMDFDFSKFENTYVKIIVKNKTNPYWFDMFIDAFEKTNAVDVKIVEESLLIDNQENTDLINECEDTLTILNKYVQTAGLSVDNKKLEHFLKLLYNEAQQMETI